MDCLCCGGKMELKGAYSQCVSCGYARSLIPADTTLYGKENAEIGKSKQLSSVGLALDTMRHSFVKRHVTEGRLLDFGCNYGHFITLFGDNGVEAAGYDINPLNGFSTPPNGPFDALTLWDVLEHIEGDPLAVIKTLIRDGGALFLSMPCVDGMPTDITRSHHWKPGEHVHFFTSTGMIQYLLRNDFYLLELNYEESKLRTGHPMNILSIAAEKA